MRDVGWQGGTIQCCCSGTQGNRPRLPQCDVRQPVTQLPSPAAKHSQYIFRHMLRLQLQGRWPRGTATGSGISSPAADCRREAGRAGPAAAAAAMAAACIGRAEGGGWVSCKRAAIAGASGFCWRCCLGAAQRDCESSPLNRPLRVVAASPSALSTGAGAGAAVVCSPLLPPSPSRMLFRLASTSAARGVVAGRPPPGVAAGALAADAGARRCSKGVAGRMAACKVDGKWLRACKGAGLDRTALRCQTNGCCQPALP